MNRSQRITLIIFCIILIPIAGCSRKGPVSVRFTRQVDEAELLSLPKQNGSIVLVVGGEFWTDRNKVGRIPIARREKTFIIGPGAAEMAEKMLRQMFSRVERVRHADQGEDVEYGARRGSATKSYRNLGIARSIFFLGRDESREPGDYGLLICKTLH